MNTHFINFFFIKISNFQLSSRSKQKVLIKDNKDNKVQYDQTFVANQEQLNS